MEINQAKAYGDRVRQLRQQAAEAKKFCAHADLAMLTTLRRLHHNIISFEHAAKKVPQPKANGTRQSPDSGLSSWCNLKWSMTSKRPRSTTWDESDLFSKKHAKAF